MTRMFEYFYNTTPRFILRSTLFGAYIISANTVFAEQKVISQICIASEIACFIGEDQSSNWPKPSISIKFFDENDLLGKKEIQRLLFPFFTLSQISGIELTAKTDDEKPADINIIVGNSNDIEDLSKLYPNSPFNNYLEDSGALKDGLSLGAWSVGDQRPFPFCFVERKVNYSFEVQSVNIIAFETEVSRCINLAALWAFGVEGGSGAGPSFNALIKRLLSGDDLTADHESTLYRLRQEFN